MINLTRLARKACVIKAGTAMIMPYYGVPVGQTSEDVGMSFNAEIISDKLRKEKGYDGIVCTDSRIPSIVG